jgi:hypothetical protein
MSASLSGLEFTLNALVNTVIGMRLDLATKGKNPNPDDPGTPAFFEKLKKIGDRALNAMRELKSMEGWQQLRSDRLYALPREARYSERQSIDSQLQNIRRVRALAMRLWGEVRALYGDTMTPTTADLVEGTQNLLGEIGKTIDRSSLHATIGHLRGGGPEFVNASPQSTGVAAADVLSQVWLLLSCVFLITRKRKT